MSRPFTAIVSRMIFMLQGCRLDCILGCIFCFRLGCRLGCILGCILDCRLGCRLDCKLGCILGCILDCKLDCKLGCRLGCRLGCILDCILGCRLGCRLGCILDCILGCILGCRLGCRLGCSCLLGSKLGSVMSLTTSGPSGFLSVSLSAIFIPELLLGLGGGLILSSPQSISDFLPLFESLVVLLLLMVMISFSSLETDKKCPEGFFTSFKSSVTLAVCLAPVDLGLSQFLFLTFSELTLLVLTMSGSLRTGCCGWG